MKNLVVIVVYNRYENIKLWLNCWKQCNQKDSELLVIHNYDKIEDSIKYSNLCTENRIACIRRLNSGFDIGTFKDFIEGKLGIFNYENLIWITDDTIPMDNDFVNKFTSKLSKSVGLSCMEIADYRAPLHVRTTGFCITKETANKIKVPNIITKLDCYEFEHRGKETLMLQINAMGLECVQVTHNTIDSPLWDTGNRAQFQRMWEFKRTFKEIEPEQKKVIFICPVYNKMPYVITSLLAQTFTNWELRLIHDGPNKNGIEKFVKMFKDDRIVYSETKEHQGKWGHYIRASEIQKLNDNEFVVITNADNYHVPVYIDEMLKAFDDENKIAAYCSDMVHSYKAHQVIPCSLVRGFVDCAGVMIRALVAKSVGWNDINSHSADWFFFNDIIKRYGVVSFQRVLGCLLVHN